MGKRTKVSVVVLFMLLLQTSLLNVPRFATGLSLEEGDSIVMTLEAPQYTVDDGVVKVPTGYSYISSPGAPRLPYKTFRILLPPNADINSVRLRIKNLDSKIVTGVSIKPAPPLVTQTRWGKQLLIYNKSIYLKNITYPATPIELVEVGQMRDAKIVVFNYYPFQYTPLTKSLSVNQQVQVEISWETDPSMPQTNNDPLTREFLEAFSDNIYNFKSVSNWYSSDEIDFNPGYVIVTTNSIVQHSQRLEEFRALLESRGFNVYIITEDDYGYEESQQRAINIREWLRSRYNNPLYNIKYVLLIGDPNPVSRNPDSVPMINAWPKANVSGYIIQYAPTDYFYSDLTGNWDYDNDGYYGEFPDDIKGIDFYPEVFVGRIPVYNSNYTALDGILQRLIQYAGIVSNKILLPMAISNYENEDGTNIARTDGRDLPKTIGDLVGYFYTVDAMYEGAGLSPVPSNAPYYRYNISASNFISAWNKGYGIVMWWAHGLANVSARKVWIQDDGDGVPEANEMAWVRLVDSDIALNLNPKNTIVIQVSCLNGLPERPDNLAYSLLAHPAIATVGASRESIYTTGTWSPDGSPDNAEVGYKVLERLTVYQDALGEALYFGKATMINPVKKDALWTLNFYDFNLYGDPSITVSGRDYYNYPPRITLSSPLVFDKSGTYAIVRKEIHCKNNAYIQIPANVNVTLYIINSTIIEDDTSKTCYLSSELGSKVIIINSTLQHIKGVYLKGAGNVIDGSTIYDTKDSVIIYNTAINTTIRDSVIKASLNNGITVQATGAVIENNEVSDITKSGIAITADYTRILQNKISNSETGIYIHSSYNIIKGNYIETTTTAIDLYGWYYNTIDSNHAKNNGIGIYIRSHNDYSWYGRSWYNTVSRNLLENNTIGIKMFGGECDVLSKDNRIISNTVVHSEKALVLEACTRNNEYSSNIFVNNTIGVYINGAQDNTFYNNYFNNTQNVYFENIPRNYWSIEPVSGENIIGGDIIAGNFWATPNGTGFSETHTEDYNFDGILDIPYELAQDNVDNHPLTMNTMNLTPDVVVTLPTAEIPEGSIREVPVYINTSELVGAIQLRFYYDGSYFNLTDVKLGSLLQNRDDVIFSVNNSQGVAEIAVVIANGVGDDGELLKLAFKSLGRAGDSSYLKAGRVDLSNVHGNPLTTRIIFGTLKTVEKSLKGDINNDGIISATDALLYLRFAVGLDISPYYIDPVNDDVTGDGKVTIADALKVLRVAVGLESV